VTIEANHTAADHTAAALESKVLDQEGFGRLLERFRGELQAHCYRLMGTLADAEDMVQEAFLRAWRGRGTFEGRATFRAWLYRIATHTCLDALRRRPRRVVPRTREPASSLATPIPDSVTEPIWLEPYPDDLLRSNDHTPEAHAAVRESISLAFITALHLLPPRQRAVLLLRDVLDWRADEVAALLDMSTAAVKSALHRARTTLAERGYAQEVPASAQAQVSSVQLARYVRAWEAADIPALLQLLKDDATFSMPPIPAWYQGRETIRDLVGRTVFSGEARGRWRLRPTRANGQPAFGLYRQAAPGVYQAYGIQVLTFDGAAQDAPLVADIITFRVPTLFPRFALPSTLTDEPVPVSPGLA
jgi:RNA polymerase sigma-70 factor (ECF subfamily)